MRSAGMIGAVFGVPRRKRSGLSGIQVRRGWWLRLAGGGGHRVVAVVATMAGDIFIYAPAKLGRVYLN